MKINGEEVNPADVIEYEGWIFVRVPDEPVFEGDEDFKVLVFEGTPVDGDVEWDEFDLDEKSGFRAYCKDYAARWPWKDRNVPDKGEQMGMVNFF